MAQPSTLYRFQIDLSDIDRGVYEQLDLRTAQHPSESSIYLITRLFAFVLNVQEGLEFSPQGLSDPDAPALRALGLYGACALWIEIGNPSARKLHKASKVATKVKVYTYKDAHVLLREIESADVHRKEDLDIYSFKAGPLEELAARLERDNRWTIVSHDGNVSVNAPTFSQNVEIVRHQ